MIIPAILPRSVQELTEKIEKIAPYTKRFHLDIADGRLVDGKSITWNGCQPFLGQLPYELHLMVADPQRLLASLMKAQPPFVWLHVESAPTVPALIDTLGLQGIEAGVAVSPETSAEQAAGFVQKTNRVLIMTIHPGKTGQSFLPEMLLKVTTLRSQFPNALIGVDGGITPSTIALAARAGANHFVSSSYIFGQPSVATALADLESAAATLYD